MPTPAPTVALDSRERRFHLHSHAHHTRGLPSHPAVWSRTKSYWVSLPASSHLPFLLWSPGPPPAPGHLPLWLDGCRIPVCSPTCTSQASPTQRVQALFKHALGPAAFSWLHPPASADCHFLRASSCDPSTLRCHSTMAVPRAHVAVPGSPPRSDFKLPEGSRLYKQLPAYPIETPNEGGVIPQLESLGEGPEAVCTRSPQRACGGPSPRPARPRPSAFLLLCFPSSQSRLLRPQMVRGNTICISVYGLESAATDGDR